MGGTVFPFLAAWLVGKILDGLIARMASGFEPASKPTPRRGPAPARRAPGRTITLPEQVITPSTPATVRASVAPWPQVVPAGLPPFPGSGWVAAEPPGSAVVQRANQLLPQLWRGGEGTFKIEQTAGRWIAYRATQMGAKRGVVAFRQRDETRAAAAPAGTVPASSSAIALPTLRRGSRGKDVETLQRALGIAADGAFGPATEAAVRSFQSRKGLKVDGIVGPQTWGALLGGARAA